jgi:hypothetical protein
LTNVARGGGNWTSTARGADSRSTPEDLGRSPKSSAARKAKRELYNQCDFKINLSYRYQRMSDNGHSRGKHGQFIVAIVALVVSGFSAYLSYRSDETAKEALQTARAANLIALGIKREYPVIDIENIEKDALQLRTIDDVRGRKSEIIVRNEGPLPVVGLQLDLNGLSGLVYSLQDPEEAFKEDFAAKRTSTNLEEQLLPHGFAYIEMRIPILKYLKDLKLHYKDPNNLYRAAISVIVLPKAVGQEAPLQTAMLNPTIHDRTILEVEYVPSVIASPQTDDVSHEQPRYRVYPP